MRTTLLFVLLSWLNFVAALHARNGQFRLGAHNTRTIIAGNNESNRLMDNKPNYSLSTPEMIRSYNYPCEIHTVTTGDGYINTLHRIPRPGSRVVFLQHGFLGTSADFVMGRPDKSLGYVLFGAGYDVWLGNARGNSYSRGHVTLTTSDSLYWAFSFDEMGKFDLKAAFDHVFNVTERERLSYVGHSMGTIMFWVASNEHNDYISQKVDSMVALGPVAYLNHVRSPIRLLAPFVKELKFLFWLLGVNELSPSNALIRWFDRVACDETMAEKRVCESLLFLMTGFDAAQMNTTLLPIILGHEPGGASTRTVIHFAQEIDSGHFRKYDFGSSKMNLVHYNSSVPPDYDLGLVNTPVLLMAAKNDYLAGIEDVCRLHKELNNAELYVIDDVHYNHVDLLWALDADRVVFPIVLRKLDEIQA